ncbi:MAG: nicotinate (nicotinamide) nucleotide adenylyltransferase, partial [Balneolaceae bacterium]|nr:nicotinate (nicotinamide) nucleotide adenylyltransferase [Balneolaceae bacterium]
MRHGIGLLGGTFDPVHNGHLAIARSFLSHTLIEQLWVILSPDPPHKTDLPRAPFERRLEMLEAAFGEFNGVKISTIEQNLSRPSYTIQTVRHLKKKYPEQPFYLCIGEDSLREFHTWYRYRDLLKECELLVARRPGLSSEDVDQEIMDRAHFVDHQPVEVSSTEIRNRIAEQQPVDS